MNRPSITSNTPIPEIVTLLSQSGCPDITDQLNLDLCSQWSVDGGGQGDIFKGVLLGGEPVAIKTSRGDQSLDLSKGNIVFKRVARELYTWHKLDHRNVAKLLGMAVFQSRIAMISPWVEPGNFYRFITMYPDTNRIDLCFQVASGLAYLHDNSIVFGDLKGQNVLIGHDGVAKLTDFGLSVPEQPQILFSTTQNTGGGSTRWMAPELIMGTAGRSFEADVYALGMTFIEILTDKFPFPNLMHDVNVIFAVAYNSAVPTRPVLLEAKSSHHKKWWRLLQTCWDRRPYMRPKASAWEALRRDTDQPASQNASPESQTSSLPKMDEVLPPQWMSDCLDTLQMTYPADRFTIIVKTDPQNAEEPPLPKFRLKCLDCPGKLYTPGPEQSLANFVVHLKNRTHRSRVNSRLAVETAALVTETATAPAVTSPD